MTTRTKRRGRRSLAAILAAMLMASVLAVVAGSPAQAANTSGEYLVDHDNDANTAAVREFAGRDRYDTSLKLAKRFADDRGGIGSVSNAFIASGESLVDAVSVSGLAGFMDAPVILTPSSNLHGGVADFIEDYGISNIYVLGGTAAIADGVVDALGDLPGVNPPTRIAGDTRYDTSAAIAANLAGESWCGTNANSAIVVSGADEALFDAVAIGPVANRLELPVLLTAGDELVDAVLSYIETEDVEHVVIVGGTGSVSEAVADALSTAGVDTVERIGGDSAAATAVAIAEVIGGACADDLSPVSGNTVALVNRESLADGISAAPVLADDADQLGGGLIPIVAVGDTLPASARDYLAATPEEVGGNKVHLQILAIGGTAAVSDSVMAAAVSAAASADALSVTIGTVNTVTIDGTPTTTADVNPADGTPIIVPGRTQVRLYFTDNVASSAAVDLRNRLEDILQVNNIPADIETDLSRRVICDPDSVTVTLNGALKSGDTIAIVSGGVRVGAGGDRRTVQPTEATVPATPKDTQRPSIQIVAIIGHDEVYGLVTDNAGLDQDGLMADPAPTGSALSDLFEVTAPTARKGVITTVTSSAAFVDDTPAPKTSLLTFALAVDNPDTPVNEGVVASTDRFRANRGAVMDSSDNESQVTTGVPVRPVSKLAVSSVQMSNLRHTANAIAMIPAAYVLDDPPAPRSTNPNVVSPGASDSPANPAMWLQAKGDGAAAGAYGNLWSIRGDRSSSWDKDKDAEVQVFVSTKDRRIVLRVANGEPRFADVKAALEANATVDSMFNVLVDNAYATVDGAQVDQCKSANPKIKHDLLDVVGAVAGATAEEETGDDVNPLEGGVTKARVQVNFNGWVEDISPAESARLMDAVLKDTLDRNMRARSATVTDNATLRSVLTIDATANEFAKDGAAGPMRSRSVDITTENAAALPLPRDIVTLVDGFDKQLADSVPAGTFKKGDVIDAEPTTEGVQRQDTVGDDTSVANGYGDNGTAADTENDFNYGSKSRITRSNSVVAPL